MTFASDIQNFNQKYEERMTLVLKKVAFDLFRKVILKTPVDTGRARGNWMVGINKIPIAMAIGIDKKADVMSRIVSDISTAKAGDSVAMANTLPYIGVLEYGGYPKNPVGGSAGRKAKFRKGHKVRSAMRQIKSVNGYSYQAPHGMVRISIEEYLPTVRKIVELVKRERP